MKFRDLKADEIECRISTINAKGLSLLLYKDARVDMRILDETVGSMNWQRSHQTIDGRLYCTVEIWDEKKGQWISKQDVGTESYTEKEKGQASDSFKRAGFCWGIGRELYTAPFIWVRPDDCTIKQNGDRFSCFDRFTVTQIEIADGKITMLEIVNEKTGKVVFRMEKDATIDETKYRVLAAKCKEKGKSLKELLKTFGKTKGSELTVREWAKAMEIINAD